MPHSPPLLLARCGYSLLFIIAFMMCGTSATRCPILLHAASPCMYVYLAVLSFVVVNVINSTAQSNQQQLARKLTFIQETVANCLIIFELLSFHVLWFLLFFHRCYCRCCCCFMLIFISLSAHLPFAFIWVFCWLQSGLFSFSSSCARSIFSAFYIFGLVVVFP